MPASGPGQGTKADWVSGLRLHLGSFPKWTGAQGPLAERSVSVHLARFTKWNGPLGLRFGPLRKKKGSGPERNGLREGLRHT